MIIEDEEPIRHFLRATLEANHYRVKESGTARDGVLQADVCEGQHVRAQLVEHQEHLRGPAADAVHGGQAHDQRFILQCRPFARVEMAGNEMAREVANIQRLAFRQADAAQGSYMHAAQAVRICGISRPEDSRGDKMVRDYVAWGAGPRGSRPGRGETLG